MKTLAEFLTDELFELGGSNTPCQRIQFMCGTYPDDEINNGGMDPNAMLRFFKARISAFNALKAGEVGAAQLKPNIASDTQAERIAKLESRVEDLRNTILRVEEGATRYGLIYEVKRLLRG